MKSDYSRLKLGLVLGLCLIVCSRSMKAAGYALSFDPTHGQSVNIPHKAAQNGYPFTVMCWFQEPAGSSGGGALVNKYTSSSYNGWMIAIGGQLHAFYYRDGSDFIGNTGAGAVNDGLWHQGAFVVDASGGHLYLDGVLKQTVAWTGTPGASTTTNPIALGLYPGDSYYSGQLDEVSVWNIALTQSQIQTYMHQALTGTETGLVDYYQLNEGTGTNIYDATVNADTGTFSPNPPTWVLSPVLEPQLGATNLVEGPSAGNDSVVLAASSLTATWTATANASWLHVANANGVGSTNFFFSFDVNPGATRIGTLTIAGQTLTVVQAASTYNPVPANLTILASSGLFAPAGVSVDNNGNVYIADAYNNAIKKWTPANNALTTLVASGLNNPFGVAVDSAGSVYIADTHNNAIKKWTPSNNTVTTLVSSGLSLPYSVAVDNAGNVYIADLGHNAIKKWTAANNTVTTLVASGLNQPYAVAVDKAGNVYIADKGNNAVKKWTVANNTVTTVLTAGLNQPFGVAVDGSGNIYIADTYNNAIKKWTAVNNTVTTLTPSVMNEVWGVAVDSTGNVYFSDAGLTLVDELPRAFVDRGPKTESAAAGTDAFPAVLPLTENLMPPFFPTSDQSWLTINSVTNGVIGFSFNITASNRVAHINLLGVPVPIVQEGPKGFLGTTNLVEGPGAGIDSVLLALVPNIASSWTATANASWLHLAVTSQSGLGSTNVIFTFDANPGATRVGTLTIDGQSLTVTQAGTTYVANPAFTTTLVSSGLSHPNGIAVDNAGNIYIADTTNNAIKIWTATNDTVITLVGAGLNQPSGVAVDGSGNVYIVDTTNNAIKKWVATNNTVITLVSSGLNQPSGVAVDYAGNVYIANQGNNAVKKWTAANNIVTTLIAGLNQPSGVAVDYAGNVYVADRGNNAIKKWTAANNSVTTLVSSGLNQPFGVAVDGSGNVYIADTSSSAIKKWTAANDSVTTLVASGLSQPFGVAVDNAGNVYIADTSHNAVDELPRAFIDPTAKIEGLPSGSDTLPVVLPANENLLAPFSPIRDQSWLTINGVTNGVIGFSFDTSTSNRVANITVLGLPIPIVQERLDAFLGTTNLVEGPGAGIDSVVLALVPNIASPWTATANASWLHLDDTAQSGFGSTNVTFTFDANSGATRVGTLTIDGQLLTVIQAGATYVANPASTATLVSSGLSHPNGIAVDNAGNIYIADTTNNAIKKWTVTNNIVTTLVGAGLNQPSGVAVDGSGNVYIADTYDNVIKKWTATNNTVTTLIAAGLNQPSGVAVDYTGNVYLADQGNNAVKKWTAANNTVTTLIAAGLNQPFGVAADYAGNVYVADQGNNAIKKWTAANNSVTTLVSSGLNQPFGVAVDGSGNVYVANGDGSIQEWIAATQNLIYLPFTGINAPWGVAVDNAGNVYIADTSHNVVDELPRAFIDPTAKIEGLSFGSDTLSAVLPLTENLMPPFVPISDQPWLTINSVTNGVSGFSFNTSTSNRVANITVLGLPIPIVQGGPNFFLGTTNLVEGPGAGIDSVVLALVPNIASPWTATANASWLHLDVAAQSGLGCTNVIFTFDANSGATRVGTLTIAGQSISVTQAGATYVANPASTTTLVSSGLNFPNGIAVDNGGNVYIADTFNNAIKKWTAANNSVTTLISGLKVPYGVAVDNAGNVYVADSVSSTIKKWTATNNSMTTLVAFGLNHPFGVAVDSSGNVYIADTYNGQIKKWTVANNSVTTLVSSGLDFPSGVAVDASGNVYIVDEYNKAIRKWTAANNSVTTLVSSGLNFPYGLAVDGSGNVYIADTSNLAIKKWVAANNTVTTLVSSGLKRPFGVAVNSFGNVYIADDGNNAVYELPRAFIDPTPKNDGLFAGNDVLPPVLPSTEYLTSPFAPTSNQPWLTISGVTNGVVAFSFTTCTNPVRTANIRVLGELISVTQSNLLVTPPLLTDAKTLGDGTFQFTFTSVPGTPFTVMSTTNLALPLTNWTMQGSPSNLASNLFQFTSQPQTNDPQRFYRVSSP